ncbi:ARID/BRIGHT DNA binding domain protein [Dictyocaulus viviparus]|uniref:ARID/BRIGHT DNA binding domain protein n=1 Tax=Dictyocaulus viviparus TaxID=29172 RepID=A0A0D8XJZ0_DICVI|nr:ARID/BRIGHT DNA binding domain protein [Dictyocaulus viviparus]
MDEFSGILSVFNTSLEVVMMLGDVALIWVRVGCGVLWYAVSSSEMYRNPTVVDLYELSDDAKRKEWLDDWLSFMHRIGKPVTRIPIMAKQVLDLYELYRLVVQHGGLVEIINKKLWREITKGLNLPASITSAAFTLRTQYQKYLYDYECEKEALSNPSDLQAAIDGNRREGTTSKYGRRNASAPNFGPLSYAIPHSSAASNLLTKPFNGLGIRNEFMDDENGLTMSLPQNNLLAAYRAEQMAIFEAQQRHIERAQRAAVEAVARHSALTVTASGRASPSSVDSDAPTKRARLTSDGPAESTTTVGGQMKITTRKPEGQQADNSMVVSMEINGITYQGVLFAIEENSKT